MAAGLGLTLTYSIPGALENIRIGMLCVLPVKQKNTLKLCVGVFLGFCPKPDFPCSDVLHFMPGKISFSPQALSFIQWVSEYYLAPFSKTVSLLAPGFIWDVKKHKVLEKLFAQTQITAATKCQAEIVLNEQQQNAFEKILQNKSSPTVLHGITGSGKTEVYLKLSQHVIQSGKKVLILVPEIVLTPQMGARFRAVFGNKLAILHSGLAQNKYIGQWLSVYLSHADVVLGVRSSVFCPLKDIGLIVVDEEHDSSYKCNEFPTYHARDLAVVRAKMEQAYCVLGSASPSTESMFHVKNGKYACVEMTHKFSKSSNEYTVLDGKEEFSLPVYAQKNPFLKLSQIDFLEDDSHISKTVVSLLSENKAKNEQSMILVNRRGYVNYAMCFACKNALMCPHCSVTTTLHHKGQIEICHYCGFQTPKRTSCPHCGEHVFVSKGMGTQNVQMQLQKLLPDLRIERLDRDVLTSHTRLSKIVTDFQTGLTDCLVGTQLLAKGHDFPNVTLVVILHLEDALYLPDFRSSERTFQLLLQAMGRAGRGSRPGRIVLQSFIQNHPVVQFALKGDVHGFMEKELKLRALAWNPPFCRQILFEVRHKIKDKATELSTLLRTLLIEFWKESQFQNDQIRLAGPYPAAIERIANVYRMQLCVHFARTIHPKKIVPKHIFEQGELSKCLRVDVDPLSFL